MSCLARVAAPDAAAHPTRLRPCAFTIGGRGARRLRRHSWACIGAGSVAMGVRGRLGGGKRMGGNIAKLSGKLLRVSPVARLAGSPDSAQPSIPIDQDLCSGQGIRCQAENDRQCYPGFRLARDAC